MRLDRSKRPYFTSFACQVIFHNPFPFTKRLSFHRKWSLHVRTHIFTLALSVSCQLLGQILVFRLNLAGLLLSVPSAVLGTEKELN